MGGTGRRNNISVYTFYTLSSLFYRSWRLRACATVLFRRYTCSVLVRLCTTTMVDVCGGGRWMRCVWIGVQKSEVTKIRIVSLPLFFGERGWRSFIALEEHILNRWLSFYSFKEQSSLSRWFPVMFSKHSRSFFSVSPKERITYFRLHPAVR